jgi:hypothetical protein
MGLKTRSSENTGGLAELLRDPRDQEGIMSSGRKKMDLRSAVAYVLDEPSMQPAHDADSVAVDIDYQAVAQKLEERLATIAKEVSEQEAIPAAVPSPSTQAQPQQQQQQQQASPVAAAGPSQAEGLPAPAVAAPSQETSAASASPAATTTATEPSAEPSAPPRPAPSGRLGPKDVVMVDVRGSCENIDGALLSK